MNKSETKLNKKLRNDIIFITILISVIAIIAACVYVFGGGGNTVTVTVDGEVYGVYSLDHDIVEDIITGKEGEHFNRLVIKEGKAFIEEASCPDGICSSHSAISRNGESIVCLPNKVVVTVTTTESQNSPDILV